MDLRPYIYDNGFTKRYYICRECGSKAMREDPVGGFQAPDYLCMECGSVQRGPEWECLFEPNDHEETASFAWISMVDLAEMVNMSLKIKN